MAAGPGSAPQSVTHGKGPEAQGIEPNEALGVALVVGTAIILEGHQFLAVERVIAIPADYDHIALESFSLTEPSTLSWLLSARA